jgi:glycosyltransferase involved in cell wall biosynthesis
MTSDSQQIEKHKNFLSVIMPAYNEEKTIAQIVERVLEVEGLLELIIVDDCSTDKTSEISQSLVQKDPRIRYHRQPQNGGKTEALKTGFALSSGEVVIVQDADLEYDPAEIPDVIMPIVTGRADVAYGSRFMVKRAARVLYFSHYLANKALTFFSNCLTNINMSDVETCYKAFRGEIIRNMIITSSGFGFEIEVTAKVAKLRCAVYEVPISYYGRTYEEGKKIGFKDGVAAVLYIVKYNWLTGLKASYREMPQLLSERNRSSLSLGANEQ